MYCIYGAQANLFSVFLSMPITFHLFYSLSYQVLWAHVTVVLWVTNRNTVTMLLKVSSLYPLVS